MSDFCTDHVEDKTKATINLGIVKWTSLGAVYKWRQLSRTMAGWGEEGPLIDALQLSPGGGVFSVCWGSQSTVHRSLPWRDLTQVSIQCAGVGHKRNFNQTLSQLTCVWQIWKGLSGNKILSLFRSAWDRLKSKWAKRWPMLKQHFLFHCLFTMVLFRESSNLLVHQVRRQLSGRRLDWFQFSTLCRLFS